MDRIKAHKLAHNRTEYSIQCKVIEETFSTTYLVEETSATGEKSYTTHTAAKPSSHFRQFDEASQEMRGRILGHFEQMRPRIIRGAEIPEEILEIHPTLRQD